MKMLEKLTVMRQHGGTLQTHGLDDETLLRLAADDSRVSAAVDAAYEAFLQLVEDEPELMSLPEKIGRAHV